MKQDDRFTGLTKKQIWIVFNNLAHKRAHEFLARRYFQVSRPTQEQVKISTTRLMFFIRAHAIKQKAMR